MTSTHWQAWHAPYADENSELSRRLRIVQQHIAAWLDQHPGEEMTVVSVCAGQGERRECRWQRDQLPEPIRELASWWCAR